MSVETPVSSYSPERSHDQMHGDVVERDKLLDAADTLAAMETQFYEAQPDERKRLQSQKEQLIHELTAERPGFTLLNEALLLASVYTKRTIETVLPQDGSRVRAFGTREQYGNYLEEIYILHEKPDGGFHYIVRRHAGQCNVLYELDDQAGLTITREANNFVPAYRQPVQLQPGSEAYQGAVRELLGATLAAAGELRRRDTQVAVAADLQALHMIEVSQFAARFLEASSSADVEKSVQDLMAVKPHVLSQDALRLIVSTTR